MKASKCCCSYFYINF